jgi:hypothetical protein
VEDDNGWDFVDSSSSFSNIRPFIELPVEDDK